MARPGPPIGTRAFAAADTEALLHLNSGCQPHVARLDRAELGRLLELGAVVVVAEGNGVGAGERALGGYLIAFPDTAPYDGEEFRYFQHHLQRPFLYIDQVAVGSGFRQRGVGRVLYQAVAQHPGVTPEMTRCCEVNIDPPNPGSMDFHQRLGFERMAQLRLQDGRTAALLVRRIGA